MGRRSRRQQLTISLFPFLSVLACVIGTLTLLIAALSIVQMASRVDPLDPNQQPREAALFSPESLGDWIVHISELSRLISDALAANRQLEDLRERLARFGIPRGAGGAELDRAIEMRQQEQALARRRKRLERELEEMGSAIAVVESELSQKSNLPNDAPIALLPSGGQSPLTPYFVEVSKGGLRLRKASGAWSEELHLTDLVQRGRFKVFLEHVRSALRGTVIFLIRPDGADTYYEAKGLADSTYVRNGKLPIPGEGMIDFRLIDELAESGGNE